MAEILARVESARASAAASPPINCAAYEGRSSMTQLAQRDLHARCDPVLWTVFDVITAASQLFNSTGLRDQSLKGAGTHQYIGRKDQCATMRLLPKLLAPLLQRPVETVCEVGFVRRRALHRSAPAYTQLPLHAHFLRVHIYVCMMALLARVSLASRSHLAIWLLILVPARGRTRGTRRPFGSRERRSVTCTPLTSWTIRTRLRRWRCSSGSTPDA